MVAGGYRFKEKGGVNGVGKARPAACCNPPSEAGRVLA